jgi:hypothetical protein
MRRAQSSGAQPGRPVTAIRSRGGIRLLSADRAMTHP